MSACGWGPGSGPVRSTRVRHSPGTAGQGQGRTSACGWDLARQGPWPGRTGQWQGWTPMTLLDGPEGLTWGLGPRGGFGGSHLGLIRAVEAY